MSSTLRRSPNSGASPKLRIRDLTCYANSDRDFVLVVPLTLGNWRHVIRQRQGEAPAEPSVDANAARREARPCTILRASERTSSSSSRRHETHVQDGVPFHSYTGKRYWPAC